jgi:hypothetical protein
MEEDDSSDSCNEVATVEEVDNAPPGKPVFCRISTTYSPTTAANNAAHKKRIALHEKHIAEKHIAGFSYENPEVISPIKTQLKSQVRFKPLVASTQLLAPVTSSDDEEEEEEEEEEED